MVLLLLALLLCTTSKKALNNVQLLLYTYTYTYISNIYVFNLRISLSLPAIQFSIFFVCFIIIISVVVSDDSAKLIHVIIYVCIQTRIGCFFILLYFPDTFGYENGWKKEKYLEQKRIFHKTTTTSIVEQSFSFIFFALFYVKKPNNVNNDLFEELKQQCHVSQACMININKCLYKPQSNSDSLKEFAIVAGVDGWIPFQMCTQLCSNNILYNT